MGKKVHISDRGLKYNNIPRITNAKKWPYGVLLERHRGGAATVMWYGRKTPEWYLDNELSYLDNFEIQELEKVLDNIDKELDTISKLLQDDE